MVLGGSILKEQNLIKFLGNKDDLVWIYPENTINLDAKIQVDMGYQAIMVRNGEMELPYLPGLNEVFKEKIGKKKVSDCKIYFFNKSRDVSPRQWGTRNPIKYYDNRYKMELTMRGHGTYKIFIENPRLFLRSFKIDEKTINTLEASIKELVIEKITAVIAKMLNKGEYDFLSIHGYYDVITKNAQESLNEDFDELGFSIFDLRIALLSPVEEEQLKALKDLQYEKMVFESKFDMANKVRQANNEDLLVQKEASGEGLLCTNCNGKVTREMLYCPNCGHALKKTMVGE